MASDSWIAQGVFQSILIIASILIALAFDEWREGLEEDQLVDRAIYSFDQELQQNMERISDVIPYHNALFGILNRNRSEGGVGDISELTEIVQGFQPAILEHTAWDTAVATGALTKMDYELVNALSLTYSRQARYREQADVLDLEMRSPASDVETLTEQTMKQMQRVIEASSDLQATYQQMLEMLEPIAVQPAN